jgi:aspartate carbamoyltransferase catalytic subunit
MTRIQKERFGSAQEYETVSTWLQEEAKARAIGHPDKRVGRLGTGWG